MAEPGDRGGRRGFTGEEPGNEQIGSRRLRIRPAGRQADERRSSGPTEPQHRARVRGHTPPDDSAAHPRESDEERRRRGRSRHRRRSAPGPRGRRRAPGRAAPVRPRPARPRHNRIATISDPSPSTFARTLRSNRSRAGPATDSLTRTPTRRCRNGATETRGRLRSACSPARTVDSATAWGATLTLATRSPARTIWPSNTVNASRGSTRLKRSSAPTRTCTTPSVAARRSTRLSLGPRRVVPGPAIAAARRQPASSSWRSPASRTRTVSSTASPAAIPRRRGPESPSCLGCAMFWRSATERRRPLDQRSPPMVRSRVSTDPTSPSGGVAPILIRAVRTD